MCCSCNDLTSSTMGYKSHHKISSYWIILSVICFLHATWATNAEENITPQPADATLDLENAETKDPTKKLEIIKQIRKVNNDGSYTVGYEADDGTFKIESRDVLGNVKGTYGYVDSNGEIKRVSYTGNNGTTGLRNYPGNLSQEDPPSSVTHSQRNKTYAAASTTRRPAALAFLSTTTQSPSGFSKSSSVIQTIPRRRISIPSSTERSQYSHYATSKVTEATTANPVTEHTTTVIYAESVPPSKSIVIVRPTPHPTSSQRPPEQITRPDKLEINQVSKVMITKSRETSTSKPVTEEDVEKELDRKSVRGNNLRRQLAEKEDHYEAQPQILYTQAAGEDSSHVYGSGTGNVRPLFTTTSSPRIPALVLAARQRAAKLQNVINTGSAPTTTTEKVYARPPNRPEGITTVNTYEQTTESSTDINYLTQSPIPVVQIPASQASEDERRVFRQRQATTNNYRPPPPRDLYRIPQAGRPPTPEQYIRETTQVPGRDEDDVDSFRQLRRPPSVGASQYTDGQNDVGYEQQTYPIPFAQNPFGRPFPGGQYNDFPERPVTARDFERLLHLLVLRYQQFQQPFGRFGGGGFYPPYMPYYSGQGYAPYLPNPYQGYQQVPRSHLYDPVGFDPRYSFINRAPFPGAYRQYSEPDNVYQSPQDMSLGYEGQRLIPRKKQFSPRYFGASTQQSGYLPSDSSNLQQLGQASGSSTTDYLPPDVREELLYRMLMLAIQNPEQQAANVPAASAPAEVKTPASPQPFRKPVRSVQIIGEE
ncbi:uncharacterized protein LOC129785938 [Lutzomyia longipalpis]|uniref:uncharacterized protein LOC129785938 n=1 Tax=Lutzomyia longipalpis TaxID=7200 RepID=UPI002483AF7B|nr:uncharacterized protein LOC129785938 [Lutzomyia longipalpis]